MFNTPGLLMHVVSRFRIHPNSRAFNDLGRLPDALPVVVIGRVQYLSRFLTQPVHRRFDVPLRWHDYQTQLIVQALHEVWLRWLLCGGGRSAHLKIELSIELAFIHDGAVQTPFKHVTKLIHRGAAEPNIGDGVNVVRPARGAHLKRAYRRRRGESAAPANESSTAAGGFLSGAVNTYTSLSTFSLVAARWK